MTDQNLYKILQNYTQGWEVTDVKLTKEECKLRLQSFIADGVNPSYLKAIPDEDQLSS